MKADLVLQSSTPDFEQLKLELPAHMEPVLAAVEKCEVSCILVRRGTHPFEGMTFSPWIAILGDDEPGPDGCSGVAGFDRGSLEGLFRSAEAVLVLAAGPSIEHYSGAASIPVIERKNCILVETRAEREVEWEQLAIDMGVRRLVVVTTTLKPGCILSTPLERPEGTMLQ